MDRGRWAAYHWQLRDPQEKLVAEGDGHDNPLKLKVPASEIESGKVYTLKVQSLKAQSDSTADSEGPLVSQFAIDRD